MGCGSRGFLTPSPGAERDARAQADRALPWSDFAHQSRLPSPWTLRSEGRDAAWSGGVGIERDKGSEGPVRGLPSLPLGGFSPLLSTQLFHFGKGVSWRGRQASLFSPHLGLPLQAPSFSAFREAQAAPTLRRVIDRDDQDKDALGSDASDFSDTSREDSGGSSVVKV
ncbi:hypothetical protein P7K49_007597 [Saguinus oedipus]|uniref:Uncharacterized protein n=1 Tax=Saguinus oedipus TaxID=9490 RepID=A0ABQ9VW33_SAGOE|nr:hypothetical protein P7K49_007597 [Saguinus oedipus]